MHIYNHGSLIDIKPYANEEAMILMQYYCSTADNADTWIIFLYLYFTCTYVIVHSSSLIKTLV